MADARATIERRMERFKECEKDMKVKDFSKVGLEKGNKLDPKQVAIEERREWIKTCVDQISNTVRIGCLICTCNMSKATIIPQLVDMYVDSRLR